MYKEPSQLIFINITLADPIIINRLSGRRTCQNCSKIYHIEFSPSEVEGECDDCLHPLYTRKDDQEGVIFDRLNLFKQQFEPMRAYYLNRAEWIDLNATGTQEECFASMIEKLSQIRPLFLMHK
jgi:adenylate kinase